MRKKKKFNEFINKTIEELREALQHGTHLSKCLKRFLRILRMQGCLLPPTQQKHAERI